MFALPQLTAALVRTFNLRTEKHGDDDVTAMDLGVRVTGSSALLDMLHSNLREMLYLPPDPKQASIPGEAAPWTVLRCDAVSSIAVKHELVGRNVALEPSTEVESEMSNGDVLQLTPCNVNKFNVTAHQGGSVDIDFRVQCSNIDASAIGAGGAMLSQEVQVSITHTEVPDEAEAPDTSPKGKAKAAKDATDLFAAAEQRRQAALNDPAWPFPDRANNSLEAPPQSVAVEQSQPGTRTARGRDKTKAALAAGAAR